MIKQKLKIIVDIFMLVLLPFLMAVQITGQAIHEYIGAAMLILFLLHNIFNIKWYKAIFKGKYNLIRMLHTIMNILLFTVMLCLAYSGIKMSHYAFPFFSRRYGIVAARLIHLSASYWGLVLMSLHLGFHWNMIIRRIYKLSSKKIIIWIIRILAIIVALYGAYCFYKNDIVSYMLLKNQFVFVDYEQTAVAVIAEFISIIELWAFIGYYTVNVIKKHNIKR